MKIHLSRHTFTEQSTIGSIYIDGQWECFTIEDRVRDLKPDGSGKIAGVTAIPEGEYEVVIDKSHRFNRLMPHILGVPFFSGVRIHAGNTAADTEGCPLLGQKRGPDVVYSSLTAFESFMPKLRDGLADGKVLITIDSQESKIT